jgi:hypothetical protein
MLLGFGASVPAQAQAQAQATPGSPVALCRAAIAQAEREAGLPPRLLAAIGRVESGRRDPETGATGPWPWTINAEGRGSFFPDRAAAIAAVRALQAQGVRSIDVGCLQINLRHHPQAFASLEEAFDPLINARYAARFLGELQATRGDWMRSAAHYHSQTPEHAEAYRARVAAAWEQERAGAPVLAQAIATGTAGGAMLDNGGGRAAVLPSPGGTGGRGLDAYRAQPIPVAGRAAMMPPPAPQATPGRLVRAAGGPASAPAAQGMPALASPDLGLPAPSAAGARPSAAAMAAPPALAAQRAGAVQPVLAAPRGPAAPMLTLFGTPRPPGPLVATGAPWR